jgi:hypothetical protein
MQPEGAKRVPAEGDGSYSSTFTPFGFGGRYLPGLYTAVIHDASLRRRIHEHLDELVELKWHLRHAQRLLLGWLYTLFWLMFVVVRCVLVSTSRFSRLFELYYNFF